MNRFLLVLAGVIPSAVAGPYAYYDRPIWYTNAYPDTVACIWESKPGVGKCPLVDLPEVTPVQVVRDRGETPQTIKLRTYNTVTCQNQICTDQYGVMAGNIPNPKGVPSDVPYTWVIPQGYYLSLDEGQFTAHRHGTGPDALRYSLPRIVHDTYTGKRAGVYDVYCSPKSDTCNFEGRQVERRKLRFLLPEASTEWCDMEFCYSNNHYEFVVGRNPHGMIGDK